MVSLFKLLTSLATAAGRTCLSLISKTICWKKSNIALILLGYAISNVKYAANRSIMASLTVFDSERTDCSQQTKNWAVSVPASPVNTRNRADCSMLVTSWSTSMSQV